MTATLDEPTIDAADRSSGPACLYCDGTDFTPLYAGVRDRLEHVPGEWAFVRCQRCGSANLRPFPRSEDVAGFYPPLYTFAPEVAKGSLQRLLSQIEYGLFFRPVYRSQVTAIDRRIRQRGQPAGRLLDIGCGHGLRLLEFRRRGYEVHGMDFVPESVEYVRQQHQIPAVCTDLDGVATHFQPRSFDLVTAFYVLEHVLDVRQALEACFELLKPGGWMAAAVPLIDSVQAAIFGKRNINVCEAPRHISIPTQRAMLSLCAEAGYLKESLQLIPDPALSCAGSASLSLVPSSATTHAYGGRRWLGIASRLAGAASVFALAPWMLVENYLFRRPVLGIVLAQRPIND